MSKIIEVFKFVKLYWAILLIVFVGGYCFGYGRYVTESGNGDFAWLFLTSSPFLLYSVRLPFLIPTARKNKIAELKEAIQFNANFAETYIERGFLKYEFGDKKGAILECNEAIRLKPDFAQAYYVRGFIKSDFRDKQGALTDLNEAIRLKSDFAQAYYNRGFLKRELKNEKGALIDLQKASDLFKIQSKK